MFSGLSVSIIAGCMVGIFEWKQKALNLVLLLLLTLSFSIILQPIVLADIDFWRENPAAFSPFEYRPIWLKDPRKMLPAVEKVKIEKGNGSIDIIDWKSNQRLLSANGEPSLSLKFSTFYYPGWEARIDGRRCDIAIDKGNGSIVIEVPEGRHKIELSFRDTPVRYYGKVISVISLILISLVYIGEVLNFPRKKSLLHLLI